MLKNATALQICSAALTRDCARVVGAYTLGLLASTVHGQARGRDIEAIPGSPPDLRRPIVGCSFEPRCKYAIAACRTGAPPPVELRPGRYACCIRTGRLSETAAAAAIA